MDVTPAWVRPVNQDQLRLHVTAQGVGVLVTAGVFVATGVGLGVCVGVFAGVGDSVGGRVLGSRLEVEQPCDKSSVAPTGMNANAIQRKVFMAGRPRGW